MKTTFIIRLIGSALMIMAMSNAINAQRLLQLEMINDPESTKYYEGMNITFMIKGSDEWITRRIETIMISDNAILFDEGFFNVNDIVAVQTKRYGIALMSGALQSFGAGWTGFGIIDEVARPGKQSSLQTWVIGASSFLTGWGLRKLFYKRKHALGSRYRLRLMDLSM